MLNAILCCRKCGWRTVCGEDELARRLRTLGLLRRSPHPPSELVNELLRVNVHRLACDTCHNVGLAIVEADDGDPLDIPSFYDTGDADWQQARLCQFCRRPIDPDRLEIFPDAKRCAKCQNVADQGAEADVPEFCPKCGALLEMRVSRGGGITRYKQFCTGQPACRL